MSGSLWWIRVVRWIWGPRTPAINHTTRIHHVPPGKDRVADPPAETDDIALRHAKDHCSHVPSGGNRDTGRQPENAGQPFWRRRPLQMVGQFAQGADPIGFVVWSHPLPVQVHCS